jgi:hypothetical protein
MAANFQHFPSPSNKYQFVGPNYMSMGEQPGYIYHPYTDKYYPDPKIQKEMDIKNGVRAKDPTLTQQLAPALIATGGLAAAKVAGEAVPGYVSGLFGAGSTAGAGAAGTAGLGATGGAVGGAAGGTAAVGAGAGAASGLSAPVIVGGSVVPSGAAAAGTTGAAASGVGATGTLAAMAPYALPAIAAIAAGVNYNRNAKKYKTQGGKASFQAAAKDPMNWVIPSGLLGAAFGDKDRFLTERRKLDDLQTSGVYVPENVYAETDLKNGQSTEELIANAKAKGGNVKFAGSRKESDLTGKDIVNYATFAEKDPEWFRKPIEERIALAQDALDSKAVREHHGTVSIDWGKVKQKPIGSVAPGITAQGLLSVGKK